MMGQLQAGQERFFYKFRLEDQVPADHLLRKLDALLDLDIVCKQLEPFYSEMGRRSVDPELMIRMLLIGYCYSIRSERCVPSTRLARASTTSGATSSWPTPRKRLKALFGELILELKKARRS